MVVVTEDIGTKRAGAIVEAPEEYSVFGRFSKPLSFRGDA
jgi:hypothetical protein